MPPGVEMYKTMDINGHSDLPLYLTSQTLNRTSDKTMQ